MTPEQCVTLPDYIAFFKSIPKERWWSGEYVNPMGACCAMGHLGVRRREPEPDAVTRFFGLVSLRVFGISQINDGGHPGYQQPHPKARVLAYLTDVLEGRAE